MTRKSKIHEIRDYMIIAFAMIEGSIGLNIFLLPNHITMGGVGGIASILCRGFGIPVSVSYFALNVFLLIIALRILGYKFCLKTIYGVAIFALTSRIIETQTVGMTPLLHDQPFMATVIGAFFMGSSAGLGLSANGSTGGSDTVAAMINKYWNISLGHAIMICDLCIITSSYLVLQSWEQVIYGYVCLFVVSICVDHIVNTLRRSVQFFIISDKYLELSAAINTAADRGCTIMDGHGCYSGKDVHMLFVLARQRESQKIFRLIDEIDPAAFVSQSAVIGVYGEGFDRFKTCRSISIPGKKKLVASFKS